MAAYDAKALSVLPTSGAREVANDSGRMAAGRFRPSATMIFVVELLGIEDK